MRICIVQKKNVFLNTQASLQILQENLTEALSKGARIIVFPETWLPGYPVWIDAAARAGLWREKGAMQLYRILCEQALTVNDPLWCALQQQVNESQAMLFLGIHEQLGNSLMNSMVIIAAGLERPLFHRKLTPTYTERLVWGSGDGSTLHSVETDQGRVGGLICWEHWLPALRAFYHAQHEVVHVAQWPTVHDLHQLASRHYAFEGQTFVLASGGLLSQADALAGFDSLGQKMPQARALLESMESEDSWLLRGGSAVIQPDTQYVVPPCFKEEALLFADLDLGLCKEGRMYLDVDGHYSRPDIFQIQVNQRPQTNVRADSDL